MITFEKWKKYKQNDYNTNVKANENGINFEQNKNDKKYRIKNDKKKTEEKKSGSN